MNDAPFNSPPFSLVSKNFWQEFAENEPQGETLKIHGNALLEAILESERIRRGVTDLGLRQEIVDLDTLEALKNADSDNPKLAHAMLTLQKLAVNPTKAIRYMERLITSRQTEISQKMSTIASKQRPRGRKPFTKIIDEIVKTDPGITRNILLQKLKKHEGLSIHDDIITCNETRDEMNVDALRGALSRSKKRFQKKSKKITLTPLT